MSGPGRHVEPKPRGFLGVLGARGSFVYAFERQRLRLRKGAWKQRAGTWLAAAIYAASALAVALAVTDGWDDPTLFILTVPVLFLMPAAVLLGSPGAGTRAFAGERANGTIDALVMTPMGRYELVAGRFLAHLRPYILLFAVFVGSLAVLFLTLAALEGMDADAFCIGCAWFGVSAFLYLSGLMFGAAMGLYFSLRLASAGGALLAALGTCIAIGLVEWIGSLFAMGMLMALFVPFGPRGGSETLFIMFAFGIPLALAVAHVLVASSLVSRSAKRFDTWGRGKWG